MLAAAAALYSLTVGISFGVRIAGILSRLAVRIALVFIAGFNRRVFSRPFGLVGAG